MNWNSNYLIYLYIYEIIYKLLKKKKQNEMLSCPFPSIKLRLFLATSSLCKYPNLTAQCVVGLLTKTNSRRFDSEKPLLISHVILIALTALLIY